MKYESFEQNCFLHTDSAPPETLVFLSSGEKSSVKVDESRGMA